MKLGKEGRRLARGLFRASLTDGRLDPAKVRVVLAKVGEERPRGGAGILKAYLRMARLAAAGRRAIVESALPLDPAGSARFAESLRAKFGADLETEFRVDPALIGGARIRIGSDVWDGTVLDRLQRLQQVL